MARPEGSYASTLWEKYLVTRSKAARDDLLVFYSPLVKFVAGRLSSGLQSHVESADLVSYGIFGLIQAIEKFEPGRGFEFETFAVHRIRGSILDELRAIDWVPRSIRALAKRVENGFTSAEERLGRIPDDHEVADEIGIREKDLQKIFAQISYTSVVALEQMLPTSEFGALRNSFDSTVKIEEQPGVALEQSETQRLVREAVSLLGEREKTVLMLYYYENLTLAEIGTILGVTEGRVSQIHTKAVFQLKAKLSKLDWVN
ncbi:MAG: FliA/WhiG family RNA polymerase sigma factor [Acidimicrobiaceae bacterium]|nr:FliA/WhiG family RNA polymerase sigma factor [Acidimicrobiaceae bacterium]